MNTTDLKCVVDVLRRGGITYWLHGGRAIDLLLGFASRSHKDIDLFVPVSHYARCVHAFLDAGFHRLPDTDREEGVFVQHGDTLVDITKVHVEPNGLVHTFGLYATVPWPSGMLDPYIVNIEGDRYVTLHPAQHIAMKHAVAAWYADGQLREEDLRDIHHLEAQGLLAPARRK